MASLMRVKEPDMSAWAGDDGGNSGDNDTRQNEPVRHQLVKRVLNGRVPYLVVYAKQEGALAQIIEDEAGLYKSP